MEYRLIIKGRLPGLNEYTASCRRNAYAGAKMKKDAQKVVLLEALKQLRDIRITKPVELAYTWYELNRRRDHDNVSGFGHKVIQDALVEAKVLKDDGWDEIIGYSDSFKIDSKNPRIEVEIREAET